jgi:hypothetical protein
MLGWFRCGSCPHGGGFPPVDILGGFMRPLHRRNVSKHHSARKFRSNISRSKAPNVASAPMRGGWRL